MAPGSGRAPSTAAEKAPDAFRTISEVSEELGLPQHVLRFWETRFSQIRPLKRGGGRRLYRPDHIALLRGIKALLYDDGMTIKGVQKVLRERGQKVVMARGRADTTLGFESAVPGDATARLAALRTRLEAADGAADRRAKRPSKKAAKSDEADAAPAPVQEALDLGDEAAPAEAAETGGSRTAAVAHSIRRLEAVLERLERD
ncbi:MAG: MerR family transcriptional regulator [Pseudomonadota bacterium]